MPNTTVNEVNQKANVGYARRHTVTSTNANMTTEDFYKLMAAQMKYQDPSNPTDSSDMLNQMSQMALISSIENMNTMTKTTYAASMMGKEVTVLKIKTGTKQSDGEERGIVTGVNLSGKEMTVWVNGKEYKLSQIMQIGQKEKTVTPPKTTPSTPNAPAVPPKKNTTINNTTTSNSTTGSTSSISSVPNPITPSSLNTIQSISSTKDETDRATNNLPPTRIFNTTMPADSNIPAYSSEENEDNVIKAVG